MKSVIICEGGTDLALIQYFMETTYHWLYIDQKDESQYLEIERIRKNKNQQVKWFKKDNDFLAIFSVGGVANIKNGLNKVVEMNKLMQPKDTTFQKIIIITDRDEADTVDDFENTINKVLEDNDIKDIELCNDEWKECPYCASYDELKLMEILLLVIPFEETGALEIFLLDALSEKNLTDKKIIEQCKEFVENIDTDNKYLQHRRHKTKAKFDIYFSIRTPLEQFKERRNILKSIEWENYELVQKSFQKLGELS